MYRAGSEGVLMEQASINWQTIFLATMTFLAGTTAGIIPLLMMLITIKRTGEATHVLVNSRMGDQLRLSVIQAKRLYMLTKNNEDKKAFELAERLYNEHQSRQKTVDALEP